MCLVIVVKKKDEKENQEEEEEEENIQDSTRDQISLNKRYKKIVFFYGIMNKREKIKSR